MAKRNGPMDKTVVSLMCENIKKLPVDIDQMLKSNPDKLVRFIHGQYRIAQKKSSQSKEA